MDSKTQAKLEARARIVKAMAHPTRLFILDQLEQFDERCVCDLTDAIGTDISTVSRHLAQLKSAGLISDRKEGSRVYYTLRVSCLLNFFECIEGILKANVACQQEWMT